jgi:hypothetical protein
MLELLSDRSVAMTIPIPSSPKIPQGHKCPNVISLGVKLSTPRLVYGVISTAGNKGFEFLVGGRSPERASDGEGNLLK